jgi:hypothetical protein
VCVPAGLCTSRPLGLAYHIFYYLNIWLCFSTAVEPYVLCGNGNPPAWERPSLQAQVARCAR